MLRPTNTYSGPPRGTGHLPRAVRAYLEQHGGIASTSELRSLDVDPTTLELYRDYGALQAVRQGWHCLPSVPEVVRLAWRFGGPLACVSALEFHGHRVQGESTAAELVAELVAQPLQPVIHWSTSDHRSGDRRAVSPAVAVRQADRCDSYPPLSGSARSPSG